MTLQYTIQGEKTDRSRKLSFGVHRNLQNAKIILSKLKFIKISESVIPHQTLNIYLTMCNI